LPSDRPLEGRGAALRRGQRPPRSDCVD
jgi:hypothetical protein